MLSNLKMAGSTSIGREEEKRIMTILGQLIDMPESVEFLEPVAWKGSNLVMIEL